MADLELGSANLGHAQSFSPELLHEAQALLADSKEFGTQMGYGRRGQAAFRGDFLQGGLGAMQVRKGAL